MSICQVCQIRSERPCTYSRRTKQYYRILIRPLRHVAERCGYALGVHGSLKTDIDLIAVPWRESAAPQDYLAEELRKTIEQIIGTARQRDNDPPTKKPCGRIAYSFYTSPHDDIAGPYIDLSIMPIVRSDDVQNKTEKTETKKED